MTSSRQESIIRNSIGILAAILLHLLIILSFLVSQKILTIPAPKAENKKLDIDLSTFVPPITSAKPKAYTPPQPKPKTIEPKPIQPIQKVVPAPKIEKLKIDKDSLLTASKEKNETNRTKTIKPQIKKVIKKQKPTKKITPKKENLKKEKIIKKTEPKKIHHAIQSSSQSSQKTPSKIHSTQSRSGVTQQSSALGSALMNSSQSRSIQTSPYSQKEVSATTKKVINQLYGSEFDSYGESQKIFIENNLAIIHKITQEVLTRNGYPEIAARTGQEGINIVSFNLHSNGQITDLMLEQSMGYTLLDENTLEVIRIAYKDYPLPQKTTKIKFYVEYTIQ